MYHLIGMKSFSIYIARRKTNTRKTNNQWEKPFLLPCTYHCISIDPYLPGRSYIYIYVCVCVEREREREKKQLITTTTENYKLQNNITYIQTRAPAIIHTYIAVYTYLIFYYIYYHEITTKLLQQKWNNGIYIVS